MVTENDNVLKLSRSTSGSGGRNAQAADREDGRSQQLSLPLYGDREIMAISLENFRKDEFISVFRVSAPKYVVDMRYVPRFDFGADSRNAAFDFIERNTIYIPQPFPFHKLSGPGSGMELREAVEASVQQLQRSRTGVKGPLMILFDSARHARLAGPVWHAIIEEITRGDWILSHR